MTWKQAEPTINQHVWSCGNASRFGKHTLFSECWVGENCSLLSNALKHCVPQLSNDSIYNDLFSWSYPDNGDGFRINIGQIGRWISGDEDLPQHLLQPAMNDIDTTIELYDNIFRKMIYQNSELTSTTIDLINESMFQLLKTYPVSLFCITDMPYKLVSYAFVTALVYDALSKEDMCIETRIRREIRNCIRQCKESNKEFTSPYLLNILLDDRHLLLMNALNTLRSGLGDEWKEKIRAYVTKPDHKAFIDTSLNNQELLFYAKLLAFSNHRANLNRPVTATEVEICRAIVRCRNTKTVLKLQSEIRKYVEDNNAWDDLVENCRQKAEQTTTLT